MHMLYGKYVICGFYWINTECAISNATQQKQKNMVQELNQKQIHTGVNSFYQISAMTQPSQVHPGC